KDDKDPIQTTLFNVAMGLAAVAPRLDPKDAAQAAAALILRIGDFEGGPDALADCLSALAPRLEPRDAGQAALALVQAMKSARVAFALQSMTRGLSALAARMEPKDAVKAAAVLTQALKDIKNAPEQVTAAYHLTRGLAALGARMDPTEEAATLTQA